MLRLRTGTMCGRAVRNRSARRLIPNRLPGAGQQLGEEAEAPQPRVACAAVETKRGAGAGLVPLRSSQRLAGRLPLDLGERLRHGCGESSTAPVRRGRRLRPASAPQSRGGPRG
jgi:hypothetical protein